MKKTKDLIKALRQMRATPEDAKLYQSQLRMAADRLEELSTGQYSVTAEVAKKIYTIHELARMYDIRGEHIQELTDENRRLKEKIGSDTE